ncbi:Inherit from NOG: Low-co2 inducible protein [Seminavis robusta]|uniref:Inherit from NOG: Low-co2 inducible protein n=1 Tax=Seminavis robusta TaxID=568900 RepID=A0A9N8DPC2_9STRA|nr:Inherit from NOG: Low-co2 inducible protein [Seminavis robusta]|eukprot:Sro243_g096960.1 Inherit from NOG: Low-co2 inducible protein (567) ;mRNA; r:58337-60037
MKITSLFAVALLPAASAFVVQPNGRTAIRSPVTELSAVAEKRGILSRIFGGKKVAASPSPKPSTIPVSDSTPFPQIDSTFPGAMTNAELIDFMTDTLRANGYDESKTLIATSLCCDEVNRPLETDLCNVFDTNFNMGGLAGFPFGGATSFGAMAAHIPDGGSCAVIYGPHVGVDSKGNIGTVERRGRAAGGACCGSAVAASGYVAGVLGGEPKASLPSSPLDAQQYFVGSMLMPYAERLEAAGEKMKELPYALYDAQSDLMERILGQSGSAVAGEGTSAVLGGIQINTPPGYSDYFLPLSFDLYDSEGKMAKRLLKTDVKAFPKIADTFPGALTNTQLVSRLTSALKSKGYNAGKTLVATSLCCDEVNRPLETELSSAFDTNFNMGGLAGFPFGGATSFGAMASHIPDGGDCVVVYGPHVGVDSTGAVGTVERRGRAAGGSCCGSAVAASGYVAGVFADKSKEATLPDDPLDAQQYFVGSMLMPYAERLEKADSKMVELPYALYDAQTDLMKKIVGKSAGAVAGKGKIAVLGGVQVNTPPGYEDYYLPISFDMYDNKGNFVEKIDL